MRRPVISCQLNCVSEAGQCFLCSALGGLSVVSELQRNRVRGLEAVHHVVDKGIGVIFAVQQTEGYRGVILHFAMLESPHWLCNVGRLEDAVKVLGAIEKRSVGTVTERDPNAIVIPPKPKSASVTVLFSDKYIVGTCAIWSIYFIGQFCVYGMNAWLPAWFKGIGYSSSQAVALQTWNNFAAILSNSLCGIIGDKVGRKRNCLGAWVFAVFAIVLCSVFVAPNQFVLCIGLMLLFGFALNYAITTCNLLMPEQYPTAIRNTGVSWCQAFARFGGSASSIVLGGIPDRLRHDQLVACGARPHCAVHSRLHLRAAVRSRHERQIDG